MADDALALWQEARKEAQALADDDPIKANALATIDKKLAELAPPAPSPEPAKPAPSPNWLSSLVGPAVTFGQEALNTYSMGLYPAMTDALGLSSAEGRAKNVENNPTSADLGAGTGMGLGMFGGTVAGRPIGGLAHMATKGADAAVKPLAKAGVGAGQRAVLSGAASGAAMGAAETGTPEGAATGGTFGMLFPMFGRVASEVAQSGANLARKTSPWIDAYAAADDAGRYESPDFVRVTPGGTKGKKEPRMRKGEPGIQDAARKARDKITSENADDIAKAKATHAEETEQAFKEKPSVNTTGISRRLYEVRNANRTATSGEVRDLELESTIDEVERLMDTHPVTREAAGKDLLKTRRALEAKAERGQPATPANRPYREIIGVFNEAFGEQVPAVRAADQKAARAFTRGERVNDIVYGKDAKDVGDTRVSQEKGATRKLRREGDDTVAALADEEHMTELAEMDPRFKNALDLVKEKKAQEATKMSLSPKVHTTLGNTMSFGAAPLLFQNSRALGSSAERAANAIGRDALETSTAAVPSGVQWILNQPRRKPDKKKAAEKGKE